MKTNSTGEAWKALIAIIIAMVCVGCKSVEYVEVTNTDTIHHYTHHRDSIFERDSIYFDRYISGDTIKITKEVYKIKYKDRFLTDTLYLVKETQIPLPVEKKLTKWQQFKINAGEWLIAGAALMLLLFAFLWVIRKK